MQTHYDIAIIGGGLAGLTAALQSGMLGFSTLLIEKGSYPRHKVCGEFISQEGVSVLAELGINLKKLGMVELTEFVFTHYHQKMVRSPLPLNGNGISRFKLEHVLALRCKEKGVNVQELSTVKRICKEGNGHKIELLDGKQFEAKVVLGAFGKRSKLQLNQLHRSFYFAVKTHLELDFPLHEVQLHLFPKGYAGLSRVEEGRVNFCYMGSQELLKKMGSIKEFQDRVVFQNPYLKKWVQNAPELLPEPLTISQIDFEPRPLVHEGVLNIGDAAGMIYPLTGNGMTMAIKAATISVLAAEKYLEGTISRSQMEQTYKSQWKNNFSTRLKAGRLYQRFFNHWLSSQLAVSVMGIPFLNKSLIKATHGTPQKITSLD